MSVLTGSHICWLLQSKVKNTDLPDWVMNMWQGTVVYSLYCVLSVCLLLSDRCALKGFCVKYSSGVSDDHSASEFCEQCFPALTGLSQVWLLDFHTSELVLLLHLQETNGITVSFIQHFFSSTVPMWHDYIAQQPYMMKCDFSAWLTYSVILQVDL